MKIKKDKKLEKRSHDEEPPKEEKEHKKSSKKQKLNNVEKENGDDKTETESTPATDKSFKSVDVNIFKYFKELTNDEEKTRMEAALHLLQQIHRTKEPEKRQKELAYTLKRLIRGCGASTNVSRAGFFTGLVGIMKSFTTEELTMEQIFETLNKELHVGATIANKEDADAVVGKILVCGALLHSGRLTEANSEHLEQVTNMLLQSSRHRTYHASLGFSFLCEIIEALSQKQFETSIWPLLQKELIKPWPKQSLQTVHCLITVQKKFPNIVNGKFLKLHFGGNELLNPESFQYLHKIFWEHSNTDILTHPAFECFGSYIANTKYLAQFWSDTVDPGLENPTKLLEVETLKILTDILDNLNVEQTNVHELLTDNFMRMFIEGLKNLKQKKDETLKAFYADFLESLVKSCGKLTKDAAKVAVIKRLILPPGIFNIEKFTGHRIVHQLINTLGEEGVQDVFQLYKSIFLATLAKNPENAGENWLNFERLNAGYTLQHLLQHKSVQSSYKWREEQLKFLFTCGIFYVTDSAEICKKEAAGSFSKDFADQCKNMFYTCLQSKLSDVRQEQQLLFNLAEYCQEKMSQKHAAKYFRIQKFDEALQKSWNSMFESVAKSYKSAVQDKANKKKKASESNKKGDNKLQTVFNILLLNMGLQLFREAEMAGPAVDDLLKCMEKTSQQTKTKKSKKTGASEQEEEPEWIEVVVDLFLHLLSQNNNALRNIVNALFPHLCDNLSLSAVHQILAMLDMKDGHNPLSTKNEDEEDEDDGEEEEDDDEEMETQENGDDADSDEDEEDEDDDDDDDEAEEEDDDDDEEGVTASDKLRNAISQALIANGSAVDDDMESVDLNEMTEEEGRKLDEALANAFKALKKTNGGGSQTKKSKSYRVKTTTVMHFRIRVLDLIEIYLQQKPSLLISIEIMLALFNMLEYCVGDELKPLQTKVEKVLTKLTSHKNYTTDEELKEDNFVDFIRLIVEKKAPAVVYEIVNKMRNKCTCFLIANASKINADQNTDKILKLCQEYTEEFIKSRNPTVNITLLSDIFKLRTWRNVWNMAEDLTQHGLSVQTRTFRRIQIYEVLSVLYKNHELQKQNEELAKKHFKKIEKSLSNHLKALSENTSVKHSPKEFQTLLDLLLNAEKTHQRLKLQSVLSAEITLSSVQNLRKLIRLESAQVYQRFCNTFKLEVIRNTDVQNKTKTQQQVSESESENDVETNGDEQETKSESKAQKRKAAAKDLRKQKKQKKQQRLEAASRGLNGGIGFTQRNAKKVNSLIENGDSDEN
ncbi:Myb-binding protein 1A [Lucilia cuprina]|nr:Myb-binding protein 1A [Lucilia cuprina]